MWDKGGLMKTKTEKGIDKLYSIDRYIQEYYFILGLTSSQQQRIHVIIGFLQREIMIEDRMNRESWL
jgi:hypothetical protein